MIVRLEFKVATIQFTFFSFCILGAYDTFAKHLALMPNVEMLKRSKWGLICFLDAAIRLAPFANLR